MSAHQPERSIAARAAPAAPTLDPFVGGGFMAELMRDHPWRDTPLGPPETWPASLRTIVAVALRSRFPMLVWWGPQLIQLYNDAYRPILADKHPRSLGAPGAEVWAEIWDILGPQAAGVLAGGPATWNEHLLLPMNRRGYVEETYFTFSYSAIPSDDGSLGGVLVTCQETTEQVQDERQLRTLRDLGTAAARVGSAEEAARAATAILGDNDADVPFALVYLLEEGGREARLVATAGLDGYGGPARPAVISLDPNARAGSWRLAEVGSGVGAVLEERLAERFGDLPGGRWSTAPTQALLLPLSRPAQTVPYGYLVCGVNPHRELDERYAGFFQLTADAISAALANVHALQEERLRVERLAELDRAKTSFFTNVSHEFRTPLTLILAPVKEALARGCALSGADLAAVDRSAERLLRLVNALLDVSRIEGGRLVASVEAVDLAQATTELVSGFRPAMEAAGLALTVDVPEAMAPVAVDPAMWESIVLNLVSNAFKFTRRGGVEVTLREREETLVLEVSDTGTGIPAEHLPHVFDRFHRVEGGFARTHEGAGIGLALVRELVELHHGRIRVSSELGRGSRFVVEIPRRSAQAAAAGDARSRWSGREAAYQEADAWAQQAGPSQAQAPLPLDEPRARVLIVDDNADMRAYLRRLLEDHWHVEVCADGAAALAAARTCPPDLVVADVMMPRLDGFGLLEALRAESITRHVPVILVSARAGDEARVEGLAAGAEDYLAKPFSSRELVARVRTHLALAAARRAEATARAELEEASRRKDEFLAMLAHELRNPLAPIRTVVHLLEQRAPAELRRYVEMLDRQTTNLVRLVDDLLDVSRITRGAIVLRREPVDLVQVCRRAAEVVRTLVQQRSHALALNLPTSPVWVHGDSLRLEQVAVNLLTNAAKYTPPGGRLELELQAGDEVATLRVRDDGLGIEAALLPRVFDLFQQVEQSLARSEGGLGVGLTIVRRLVELHGGTVSAASAGLGHGSEFVVELPLLRA